MFGFKKRWIEVKKIPGVLKKTVFRREIFFWIRKEVFDFIPIERMNLQDTKGASIIINGIHTEN